MNSSSLSHIENDANFLALEEIQSRPTDLFLSYCGIHHCPPLHFYGNIPRSVYLIHIVLHGKGSFSIGANTYSLTSGDAFLIPPARADYSYQADASTPWSYMWIGFGGTKATTFLEQTDLSITSPTCRIHVSLDSIHDLILRLIETKSLTLPNDVKRIGILYNILSLLITSRNTNVTEAEPFIYPTENYALFAQKYIENNYSCVSISALAEQLNINRTHLHSIFKQYFQVSPQEYLMSYRMKIANQLLQVEDFTITQIAEDIGYEDPLQFSKIFKKYYGVSPKNYRSTLQQEKNNVRK